MEEARTTFLDLAPEEAREAFAALGVPAYRADQVRRWVYGRFVTRYEVMTDLPKALRDRLETRLPLSPCRLLAEQRSREGVVKGLLLGRDHATAETVVLPHPYGTSVCVSSQVGCRQGCAFCATALSGFTRSLTAAEMTAQYLYACAVVGRRIGHVVLMGAGEPLDNFDEVVAFIRRLASPATVALSPRRITVSTVGLVPEIRRLASLGLPVRLALSLHAADDRLRSALVPENRRYPLAELLAAVDAFREATGRRVTYEYVLIGDVNDDAEAARRLGDLVAAHPGHVNLIPWNPVPELAFRPPTAERVRAFQRELRSRHVNATVRRPLGRDIDAACGQLRRRFDRKGEPVAIRSRERPRPRPDAQ